MKPETAEYMACAREALDNARAILAIDLPKEAARNAYYAAFNAAKAMVFERRNKCLKTHDGVNREFNDVARQEPALDREIRAFVARAYDYKMLADYPAGRFATLTIAQAAAAVETAERFVSAIATILSPPAPPER